MNMTKHQVSKAKQTCTKCGEPSIPGLIKAHGKCPWHWAEGNWGRDWAIHCNGPEPKRRTRASK